MKDKYTIGEVSTLLNIREHTIRYWEKEFTVLRPGKSEKGRREFDLDDIKLLKHIKELLYTKGYTIKGAMQELERDVINLEIQSKNPLDQKSILSKSSEITHSNKDSLLKKDLIPNSEYYLKINHEILSRVYQEVDDLLKLWLAFPNEIK
jgi:DNA-binding transcriptional MerR regulator